MGKTKYEEYPDATRQEVIDLYLAGKKLGEIVAATDVSRPTIYWMLHQAGITPNRQKPSRAAIDAAREVAGVGPATDLLERLLAAERTIGQLQAENEALRAQLNM
jgi:hypothetical protein